VQVLEFFHQLNIASCCRSTLYTCQRIICKPKGKTINVGDNEGVLFNDSDIGEPEDQNKIFPLERIYDDSRNPQNRSFKLPGVLLDEHLSFNQHCNNACNKLSQANYIINRVKHFLPKNSLKTLYYSLFYPHLLYCLPAFGCTAKKNINRIMLLQKKVIRVIGKVNPLRLNRTITNGRL
jgi:hypothetical protein